MLKGMSLEATGGMQAGAQKSTRHFMLIKDNVRSLQKALKVLRKIKGKVEEVVARVAVCPKETKPFENSLFGYQKLR